MKNLQDERNEIIAAKNKLIAKMEEITQQLLQKPVSTANTIGTSAGNSLFWRPSIDFDNLGNILPRTGYNDKKKFNC